MLEMLIEPFGGLISIHYERKPLIDQHAKPRTLRAFCFQSIATLNRNVHHCPRNMIQFFHSQPVGRSFVVSLIFIFLGAAMQAQLFVALDISIVPDASSR